MGLTPKQVRIVSYYPLWMPVIMLLTDRVLDLVRRHEPHDEWLRDAHRHVTWSSLLTKRFGPNFAALVTDAQEMRPGNTPNERRLLAEGVALEALPMLVWEDPNIIQHPDEVDSFGKERLLR